MQSVGTELQANTMGYTAVKGAKVSSRGQSGRTSPTPVETKGAASWTKDRGTDASIADTRNASRWE